jgi:hypothetical protein
MYHKFGISTLSVLGLITLAVSAQPPTLDSQSSSQAPQALPAGGSNMSRIAPSAEEFNLARQSEALAKQLGKAEGKDKLKITAKLTETLDMQFNLRQKRHEAEIEALENQVRKLKEQVQKRQANRRDIVNKRLEQLMRDADGLSW